MGLRHKDLVFSVDLKGVGRFIFPMAAGDSAIMYPKQEAQVALFFEFSLEVHVPQDHLLRSDVTINLAPSISKVFQRNFNGRS